MHTRIKLIIDRSGSMSGKEADVIGGINTFLDDQKKVEGEATIGMVRFDNEYENFRPDAPLANVSPITAKEYKPRGSTCLLDAIGRTLNEMDGTVGLTHPNWWRSAVQVPPATISPDRAIVVIITDGQENSSREFKLEQIKAMIQEREKSGKWDFIYLGASVNAFAEASGLGIAMNNTAQYVDSGAGTATAYGAASDSVRTMRMTGSHNAGLGRKLDEDEAQKKKST